eukprot:15434642-Alexandrium_andersonii.AAC.1
MPEAILRFRQGVLQIGADCSTDEHWLQASTSANACRKLPNTAYTCSKLQTMQHAAVGRILLLKAASHSSRCTLRASREMPSADA